MLRCADQKTTGPEPLLRTPGKMLQDASRPVRPQWIEVVPHLDAGLGGVAVAVPRLAAALCASESIEAEVAAFCAQPAESMAGSLQVTHWPAGNGAWLPGSEAMDRLQQCFQHADGVHIHGLWEACTRVAASTARSLGKPYLLSAHGMLDPWALRQKRLKKLLYSALIERANVCGASCLHALTTAEAEDYRRFGCSKPIVVIPNGVSAPEHADANAFLETFPQAKDRRVVLFLGRLHPKKGVGLLLEAWCRVAPRFCDTLLVFAGPDGGTARADLEASVGQHQLRQQVLFTGMLNDTLKWSALAAADAFVLPSYSEGFSVAVLEALAMGVPTIVSDQCHLPELERSNAGWEIKAEVGALAAALEELLSNSSAANRAIGERARMLVQERFTWPVVAHRMAEVYRWMGGGARPELSPLLEVR